MAVRSLANLIGTIRDRTDTSGSNVVTDTELTDYINASYAETYGLQVRAYEDYFISSYSFTTTSNVNAYAMPDHYKICGVDLLDSSGSTTFRKVDRTTFGERDQYSSLYNQSTFAYGLSDSFRYYMQGDNLVLAPVPTAANYLRVWYVPNATYFSASSQTHDFRNSWDDLTIIDVCIKVKDKQDQDSSTLMAQKMAMIRRIESEVSNRVTGDGFPVMAKGGARGRGRFSGKW